MFLAEEGKLLVLLGVDTDPKEAWVLGSIFGRFVALPFLAKAAIMVAALFILGLCVLLSPLVVVVAGLALLVAVLALALQFLWRRTFSRR